MKSRAKFNGKNQITRHSLKLIMQKWREKKLNEIKKYIVATQWTFIMELFCVLQFRKHSIKTVNNQLSHFILCSMILIFHTDLEQCEKQFFISFLLPFSPPPPYKLKNEIYCCKKVNLELNKHKSKVFDPIECVRKEKEETKNFNNLIKFNVNKL